MRTRLRIKPTGWVTAVLAAILAVVMALYGNKADARHPSCSDLHAAAFLDEPRELQGLLRHGADINCLDALGQTPLITAVNGASYQCFKLLLDAGAKVNVKTEYGEPLLTHVRGKARSFDMDGGERLRAVFARMASNLETAGAME